jgi:hypothetical protein
VSAVTVVPMGREGLRGISGLLWRKFIFGVCRATGSNHTCQVRSHLNHLCCTHHLSCRPVDGRISPLGRVAQQGAVRNTNAGHTAANPESLEAATRIRGEGEVGGGSWISRGPGRAHAPLRSLWRSVQRQATRDSCDSRPNHGSNGARGNNAVPAPATAEPRTTFVRWVTPEDGRPPVARPT